MMKIILTLEAEKERKAWVKRDRKAAEKIEELLREVAETPYFGRGKPEPLKYELAECWSRRINRKDRLVYRVNEEAGVVEVLSMMGHYGQPH